MIGHHPISQNHQHQVIYSIEVVIDVCIEVKPVDSHDDYGFETPIMAIGINLAFLKFVDGFLVYLHDLFVIVVVDDLLEPSDYLINIPIASVYVLQDHLVTNSRFHKGYFSEMPFFFISYLVS